MNLINKTDRAYIAYDVIIKAGETIETDNKNAIKILLSQPGVEEFIPVTEAKALEEENKKLKEELKKTKTTKKTTNKKVTK